MMLRRVLSMVAVTTLGVPATSLAAGFSTVDSSVVAMGTGGAGTARVDDVGAALYNPAALTMQPGLHASIGAILAAPRLQAQTDAWTTGTQKKLSFPPHVHLAWSNEQFTAGATFSVPFGSKVAWPEDWARRFDVQQASLTVLRASAFAGYRWRNLAFAVGPFVDFGHLEIQRAIDFVDVEGVTSLDTRATGFGGHAAMFVRATDSLDLGLTYRSRSKLSLSGYADFSVPAEFRGRAPDQAVSTKIILPDRIAMGANWRVRPDLELTADLEAWVWSTVDELLIDFAEEGTSDVRQARDWRSTLVPRVGATWIAFDWLKVRAGGYIDPTPTPKETVGPSSPDSTRLGLSLGATVSVLPSVDLSVAYQRIQFLGSTEQTEAVRFSGSADLAGASVSVRL